jgi:hypothetical protein
MKFSKYIGIDEAMSGKRVHEFKGVDEVGDFWVVTRPTKNSEMADIFFKADIFDIALQLRGGLMGNEIVGIYKNQGKAKKQAQLMLAAVP